MQFQIIMTGECNFACVYCMQKNKKNITLTKESILQICNYIIDFSIKKKIEKLGISIIGGEPLICIDKVYFLVDTLRLLCIQKSITIDISYEISTNASLLTKEIVNFFVENQMQPFFGFDGIKRVQILNRKSNAKHTSFDLSYRGLKLAYKNVQLRKKMIINSVITANNAIYLSKNFNFLRKHFNDSYLSLNFAYNTNWTDKALSELENQLQLIAKKYLKIILHEKDFSLKLIDEQIIATLRSNITPKSFCGGGKSTFSVSPNCNILPCGSFTNIGIDEEKLSIGSIFTGISEDKVNSFQDHIVPVENESCSVCEFSNRCRRFCPFNRYMSSGNEATINDTFCELSKVLIRVTDKFIDDFYKKDKNLFMKKYISTDN